MKYEVGLPTAHEFRLSIQHFQYNNNTEAASTTAIVLGYNSAGSGTASSTMITTTGSVKYRL